MPLYKYISFLKDCGLIVPESSKKGITSTEAEIMFTKAIKICDQESGVEPGSSEFRINSDSKKDKLGFNDFCNTLTQLAGRIYPSDSDNDSFIKLFNANIPNLFSNETARIKLMVKESSVIELLKLLNKSLKVYMKSYMNKQN